MGSSARASRSRWPPASRPSAAHAWAWATATRRRSGRRSGPAAKRRGFCWCRRRARRCTGCERAMRQDHETWGNDPVLAPLLAAAAVDPEVEGLILSGSRGAGIHDAESDYDIEWVLTDAAYDRRA